jgi:hypothetical protein
MKITFETNTGTFVAYLTAGGNIVIYMNDDETPVAVIDALIKRCAVMDFTSEGVAKAVQLWLESNYERMETERVIAQLKPPSAA